MKMPDFDFNIITYMTNHICYRTKGCDLFCREAEVCLRLDLTQLKVSDGIENTAKYLIALGVEVGTNYYYQNEPLALNKLQAIKCVKTLCEAKYLSASVQTNGIVILDDDHDLGSYETVLYDCHITEDNKVVFDRQIKYVEFDEYNEALEYALTANRF